MRMFSLPDGLLVMTAILCAAAAPFLRAAVNAKTSVTGLCFGFAAPLIVAGMLHRPFLGAPPFGSEKGFALAFVGGSLFAAGFFLASHASILPGGHALAVGSVIASFAALSIPASLMALGESDKIRVPWVVAGTTLAIGGVIITAVLGTRSS